MYNGIGLQTPRGSGTNGYIQTNKFFVKSRTDKVAHNTKGFEGDLGTAGISKKPNIDILEHDRKRQIHLKLAILEDKLLDQGYTDSEISEKLEEARSNLEAAAATSQETGGLAIAVVSETKVSDTQSHQVAARKEKQLETLRAALGIGNSEQNEQNVDMSDDGPRNSQKSGNYDVEQNEKHEHAFLDRDFSRKKNVVEDKEVMKDDKKRGKAMKSKKKDEDVAVESMRYKKEERRNRRDLEKSDTCNAGEFGEGARKKHHKARHGSYYETDSDLDNERKKRTRKQKKNRRHETDSSDSATNDESDSDHLRKRRTSRKHGKSRRRGSDSSDSSTDDDTDSDDYRKKRTTYLKSERHDSDSNYSATDSDDGKKGKSLEKHSRSRRNSHDHGDFITHDSEKFPYEHEFEKHKKSYRKHESDYNSDVDLGLSRQKTQEVKPHVSARRRHDSGDDNDNHVEGKRRRSQVKKLRNQQSDDGDIADHSDPGRSDSDIHYRQVKTVKNASDKERVCAEDRFNSIYGKGDCYTSIEEKDFRSNADAGGDERVKSGLIDLYKSKRDPVDDLNIYDSPYTMRNNRKLDDRNGNKQHELNSQHGIVGGELEQPNTGSDRNKNGERRDDHVSSMRFSGHGDDIVERRGKVYRDDSEIQRQTRRHDLAYKTHAGEKSHTRNEEDHRSLRYYKRETGEKDRRHGRDDEYLHYGSRRRGREEEDQRSKDRERDYYKRGRYEDSQSRDRRYVRDKHDSELD
ncbi:hypothetical protein K2173_005746 [Erythroxylum novogranatense]|uniref:CWF21 domain-containing protein n=1 Tax=Erythroxylum novogranatense TaxID=1862640 RepID=A0AAV8U2Q9_9ROSI|nr:hypothetical protein K2173_005746 [Erythroxylum novogranatense]